MGDKHPFNIVISYGRKHNSVRGSDGRATASHILFYGIMVLLLDLDEDVLDPNAPNGCGGSSGGGGDFRRLLSKSAVVTNANNKDLIADATEIPAPQNLNGFSAALGCYPLRLPYLLQPPSSETVTNQPHLPLSITSQISHSLDLNDLDALSLTCRQFRSNLLPFRRQLVRQTLRCENEAAASPIAGAEARVAVANGAWRLHAAANGVEHHATRPRMTSGKVGACARDMVGDCRRCGRVVCRVSF